MPTHMDHRVPYDDDHDERLALEERSSGKLAWIVAAAIFALVIYYMFLR